MGIRIRKVLCYGLADVKIDEKGYTIADDRFIRDGYDCENISAFIQWYLEEKKKDKDENLESDAFNALRAFIGIDKEDKETMEARLDATNFQLDAAIEEDKNKNKLLGMVNRLDKELHESNYIRNIKYKNTFHSDPMIWDFEHGIKGFVGFIAPEAKDWKRNDNLIDYYEAADSAAEASLMQLDSIGGIYPYGTLMRLKYGIEPQFGYKKHILTGEFNRLVGRWDTRFQPDANSTEEIEWLLKSYRNDYPNSIFLWAYWAKIFRDPIVSLSELKPYLYTYWA